MSQNHPYRFEPIEVTRFLGFDLGNTWNYCMCFRDNGTPKKDLQKALWYLKDFRRYFIDIHNVSLMSWIITDTVEHMMAKIIETEECLEVKNILSEVRDIVINGGILNPKRLDKCMEDLDKFSSSLS